MKLRVVNLWNLKNLPWFEITLFGIYHVEFKEEVVISVVLFGVLFEVVREIDDEKGGDEK